MQTVNRNRIRYCINSNITALQCSAEVRAKQVLLEFIKKMSSINSLKDSMTDFYKKSKN